ncbi:MULTISPECIES: hypothetical protein [Paenarthrobacter]|uniref:Uncharacterized protein n=1 Tax=Paenarthrobacter ureafaciens TaxID=37931 RepID=A0AAX3EH02_PAEUR|nr:MULTISPECIES: hypothetical protein [Paenarthrobacter]NKR11394.1 hypothetical protein [Arthrobacter sp. M5]NKR14368.1 hypothetical protein [Arthrobacter sp. M6]MDO5866444.1 hypothetical protein [Paenarthrobacter sp. SD-2]MDO5877543.1 hypothetical protein [Paenarthrobacter sp. SD-1]QMU84048.1 hypothetical protein FV140_19670 [Paenarthrobacter ureafaciens]
MEDPTTLAINLTYLGTLGMAVLMFLGLGFVIIITLVVAGIGRLLSIIILALFGIFPKKETTPIVHLPQRPEGSSAPVGSGVLPAADLPLNEPATGHVAAVAAAAVAAPPVPSAPPVGVETPPAPAPPKRDLLGEARRRVAGAAASVKDGTWKSMMDTQTNHHPLVVAAGKEPPVLAKGWAEAVAEADQRAAARAKAEQPPAIKVTVREVGESGSPAKPSSGNGPSPDAGTAPGPADPAKKAEPAKPVQPAALKPLANKQGPKNTAKGKSPGQVRKGSLSGASRNS